MSFIMTHNIPLQKVFFNHYIFIYLKQIFILMTFKSVIADHFWGNVMRYNIVYFDYLYINELAFFSSCQLALFSRLGVWCLACRPYLYYKCNFLLWARDLCQISLHTFLSQIAGDIVCVCVCVCLLCTQMLQKCIFCVVLIWIDLWHLYLWGQGWKNSYFESRIQLFFPLKIIITNGLNSVRFSLFYQLYFDNLKTLIGWK